MGFKHLLLGVVCVLVCACARRAQVCGVSYGGCTPWELAARLDADARCSFRPAAVDYLGSSKALITGWSLPSEKPDTIFCDLHNGKVVHAHLLQND